MPVGSIRPKSRSACFPGNVWANAEYPTWKPCAPRLRHGTSTLTVTEPSLNGTSLASTPREVSTIKQTYLRGHGTSWVFFADMRYRGDLLRGRYFIWKITKPQVRAVVLLADLAPGSSETEISIQDVITGEKRWVTENQFREACVLLNPFGILTQSASRFELRNRPLLARRNRRIIWLERAGRSVACNPREAVAEIVGRTIQKFRHATQIKRHTPIPPNASVANSTYFVALNARSSMVCDFAMLPSSFFS